MADPFVIVFASIPVTQLDFTGPFEVLRRMPGARLVVASRDGRRAGGRQRIGLRRLVKLEESSIANDLRAGGEGQAAAVRDADFLAQVRRLGLQSRYITSVCTGSLILAAAGLLQGKRAACHWGWRELLADAGAIPDQGRVVRDGDVISGGGVTAGIDFALTMVAELSARRRRKRSSFRSSTTRRRRSTRAGRKRRPLACSGSSANASRVCIRNAKPRWRRRSRGAREIG